MILVITSGFSLSSALYVVDLKKFRKIAAGDRLRGQYQGLSQDPNSLSNLDQVSGHFFWLTVLVMGAQCCIRKWSSISFSFLSVEIVFCFFMERNLCFVCVCVYVCVWDFYLPLREDIMVKNMIGLMSVWGRRWKEGAVISSYFVPS